MDAADWAMDAADWAMDAAGWAMDAAGWVTCSLARHFKSFHHAIFLGLAACECTCVEGVYTGFIMNICMCVCMYVAMILRYLLGWYWVEWMGWRERITPWPGYLSSL